jgi:NAD(P)-dependent dehydrogenase (short-subunit alcohol dehydrogenase family)
VSRDRKRGAAAVAELGDGIEFVTGDLSRIAEVRRVAEAARGMTDSLHVLVHNAAVFMNDRETTEDGLELTFTVNQMAPFLLTDELLVLLRAATRSRVVSVSSEAHRRARFDLTDLQLANRFRGMTAYANSKLAVILFTKELAHRLEGSGVACVALHPGVVDTELLQRYYREIPWFLRIFLPLLRPLYTSEARVAAGSVVRLAADLDDDEIARHTGCYFTGGHVREPAPEARSSATAAVWFEALRTICKSRE